MVVSRSAVLTHGWAALSCLALRRLQFPVVREQHIDGLSQEYGLRDACLGRELIE